MHHGKEVFRIWWGDHQDRLCTCRRCKILYTDGSVDRHYEPITEDVCFSNFFEATFEFIVPEGFCAFALSERDRIVSCYCSEKAIMLCKAAIMGDRESYFKIARSQLHPGQIKKMGRQVKGFEERKWMEKECSVAFQVVYQKFSKINALQDVLLSTEDFVLAEATSNDRTVIGVLAWIRATSEPRILMQWLGTKNQWRVILHGRSFVRLEAVPRQCRQVMVLA